MRQFQRQSQRQACRSLSLTVIYRSLRTSAVQRRATEPPPPPPPPSAPPQPFVNAPAAPSVPVTPVASRAAPEAPKALPTAPQTAALEVSSSSEAPETSPKAQNASPALPAASPAVPSTQTTSKAPPVPPAAPEAPRAAPTMPEVLAKAASNAPNALRTPTSVPTASKVAPPDASEAPSKAQQASPLEPTAAVPQSPAAPKAAPVAPPAPKVTAAQPPKAAPVAPEAPRSASVALQLPEPAPVVPKAASTAPPKAPSFQSSAKAEWRSTGRSPSRATSQSARKLSNAHRRDTGATSVSSHARAADGAVTSKLLAPPLPPPPPPPPAPQPVAVAAAAPPPAPPQQPAHTVIAPPTEEPVHEGTSSTKEAVAAVSAEQELFEALRPSLSTRVEQAVRRGQATHALKPSHTVMAGEEIPTAAGFKATNAATAESNETEAAERSKGKSGGVSGNAPGDWAEARRDAKLQSLPDTIANSLDKHEVPPELGGAEHAPEKDGVAVDADPGAPVNADEKDMSVTSTASSAVTWSAAEEQLPLASWGASAMQVGKPTPPTAPQHDAAQVEAYVTVTVLPSPTAGQCEIVVQLQEAPETAAVLLRAISYALDEVEAQCKHLALAAKEKEGGPSPSSITVTWCARPHCAFFGSAEFPVELSVAHRVAYVAAKEEVMQRFHRLVRQLHGAVRFVAVASSSAGAVADAGAEVFLACPERYLVPSPPSARSVYGSKESLATALPSPPTSSTSASLGFPAARIGLYPSTSTVSALQHICGAQSTIRLVPLLHSYDVRSLEGIGLLHIGYQSDGVWRRAEGAGATSSTASSSSTGHPPLFWSQWCERLLLDHVCRSPAQRKWTLEHLLWSRDFQHTVQAHASAAPPLSSVLPAATVMEDTWYAYAMGVFCHGREAWRQLKGIDSAGLVDSAALLESFVSSAPCRGAAHVTQVLARSLRRPLPSLPHRRFLTFLVSQKALWQEKMQALAATPEPHGAAVFLDCSDRAVLATLELVETHLVATPAQRARLPYLNIVLIGAEAAVQPALRLLPCAAVISSSSVFRETSHPSVQQVRLYAAPEWPADLSQDTLVAALTYLKSKETPHVVAAGAAPQRLLLALCREALWMSLSAPDVKAVETAAQEHLGLRLGPFALMDAYGTAAIATMAAEESAREVQSNAEVYADASPSTNAFSPSTLLNSCTRTMAREGLLGLRGFRGGFYGSAAMAAGPNGHASVPVLRDAVFQTYVRRQATAIEVADRLRAAVLNVACELLMSGEVRDVDSVDVFSVCALGWREETGGVLYQTDTMGSEGLPRLVDYMTRLSSSGVALHLAPHPLLQKMVAQQLRFTNLADSGLLPPPE